MLTILNAMRAPELFARFFAGESWRPWFLALSALFGLTYGLTADDEAFILECLGRSRLPTTRATEGYFIVGRRGGKSRAVSLLAVYLACFVKYQLAPGERAIGMVIAPDRRQARVVFRYITALIETVPMLAALVERRTKEALHLTNGVSIEVHTASYRHTRGYSIAFAIIDEAAFLPSDESAEPDVELLTAVRPGMATIPDAMLIVVSTPYARRGVVWEAHDEHFGKDDDAVLVWQADTQTMNPTIDARIIERAYSDDEAVARAEYGAEFRTDLERLFTAEAIDAVVIPGRRELAPSDGANYVAFVDPSGGSADSMTLAIGHSEGHRHIIDLVREVRPPFSPDVVVAEFASVLRQYDIRTVTGDRYAGEWPRERFRAHGIEYVVSELTKADLYRELLPLVNSGRLELLDHPRLLAQLATLERRTGRSGRDLIDAPRGRHEDLANVVAGVCSLTALVDGRMPLREIVSCAREDALHRQVMCLFWDPFGQVAGDGDPACTRGCAAWASLKLAYESYLRDRGEPVGYRQYLKDHIRQPPNAFAARRLGDRAQAEFEGFM